MDLSNHSYVDLTAVGNAWDGSDSVQCHTDLDTCCRRAQGPDRGDWYSPSGELVRWPLYSYSTAQRVDLERWGNGAPSGIYHCDIETNAVNDDDGRETVYVGLYASGGEPPTEVV